MEKYKDCKNQTLNNGDKIFVEYFEENNWTEYNSLEIVIVENEVLVQESPSSWIPPVPITTFSKDQNFRFTKIV